MIGSNLLGAASVSALMLVSSRSQLWLVLLAIFTENAGAAFFSPAYSGVVPALVGRGQDLNAANAWSSFAGGAVRIAGAPLGGALYTLGGFRLPVAIDAGTYLASAGLVAAISILAPPAAPPPAVASGLRGVAADLRAGVSALHADRVLAMLLFASSLFLLGNGALTALLVPYVVGDLGAKAASLGGLYCALGAGFLVSAYLGRRASASLRLRSWAVGLLVTETAAFAGLFNVHHFVLAFPFIGLVGVAGGAFLMLERTTIQRRAPDHVVGRISSAYSTVVMAATLGGALVASLIAAWAGRTAALNLAIGIVALGAVAAARLPGTVAAAPAPASA
jgi:predicted MFS family arabinose efflux permease